MTSVHSNNTDSVYLSRLGFTLVELLTAIAIIAVLSAIALPVVAYTRQKAYQTTCLSNMRQLGQAFTLYAQDYDGVFVPATTAQFVDWHASRVSKKLWYTALETYLKGGFPTCPLRELPKDAPDRPFLCGYAINIRLSQSIKEARSSTYAGIEEARPIQSSLTISFCEARAGIYAIGDPDSNPFSFSKRGIIAVSNPGPVVRPHVPGDIRHSGRSNYAFLDGHVQSLERKQISIAKRCEGTRPCFGL